MTGASAQESGALGAVLEASSDYARAKGAARRALEARDKAIVAAFGDGPANGGQHPYAIATAAGVSRQTVYDVLKAAGVQMREAPSVLTRPRNGPSQASRVDAALRERVAGMGLGERLPTHAALGAELGATANVVTRAMGRLRDEGLVVTSPLGTWRASLR